MNNISLHAHKNNPSIRLNAFQLVNKKRILIVDSDIEFVKPISAFLSKSGFEITICIDGIKAVKEANSGQYQLILLDIILPNINGFELLKSLRSSNKAPIMILTSQNELFDKIYGLEIGADDYLTKPMNQRELLARINAIFRRIRKVEQQPIELDDINDISISLSTREVYCCGNILQLTGYEFEVLHYLILNAGSVISKDDIVEYIHGRTMPYNDRSVDMHICNIRKKISLFTTEQKIKTIRGAGYIFLRKTI